MGTSDWPRHGRQPTKHVPATENTGKLLGSRFAHLNGHHVIYVQTKSARVGAVLPQLPSTLTNKVESEVRGTHYDIDIP